MLLSAYRGCIGAPIAPTEPTLVSVWNFDETGTTSFADDGPAQVPMDPVGTWADLTTGSLVEGVNGTSAYTDGSAYATMPADVAAHDLAALTISFYYQRESASEKHILLAGGNGSQVGDFSIEVLPNGRLRGWHTGQDGTLRFFESTNGVTDTNLQVGTAHRIELALGPQGARVYLDGVELPAAAIPENTNGWNNGRVKYLGRWIDGVQSPAHGVFDRLRIWNQQLTSDEIALLEPAQSITLPEPEPGDVISVPSLAEWLVSDEADPPVTKYVSNQNRGDGSGSSAANAQEVQAALNGASPGQTFLAVCQTPGVIEFWDYPSGLSFPNGTAGNLITLQARQGDGVVISRGEDFAGARIPSSGFWTQSGLSQSDIDKKIWRSSSTFSGGDQTMMGFWIEFDHPHQLLRYSSMTNLRADYGTSDSPTNYATPGVHKDSDGHVWIRFQRPHPGKYSTDDKWSEHTWPGHPEAVSNGQIVYPVSEDPNDYQIHLFRVSSNVVGFDCGASGGFIKIGAGINSLGYRHALTGHDVQCDRGTHLTWMDFLEIANSGSQRTNFFMNRVRCSDGSKIHASRSEWKFGGWLEGIRSACFRMQGDGNLSGIYWKDCTIAGYHEIFVGDANANQVRFRNCTMLGILDDGIQAQHNMSRCEIGYCYFRFTAYGGMGTTGSEGNDANPGGWFIHHNVFDNRQERNTNWRAQPHPHFVYLGHSPDGNSPRKIYNNLIIWGPDNEEENGPNLSHCPAGSDNTSGIMHEVFNNIILRVFLDGSKRYDAISGLDGKYSDNLQGRSDYVNGKRWVRYSAEFSNELFDFNLYWRSSGLSVDGLLREYARGSSQTQRDFDTLADWKAHSEFEHSKLGGSRRGAYSPGFDGNSTDSKPTLPAIDNYPTDRFKYRPAATSAVTTASADSLSGANWWSTPPSWGATNFPWNEGEMTLAPSNWKGPLDPNGTTLPIGVQNP